MEIENPTYKDLYEESQRQLGQIRQELSLLRQINARLYEKLASHAVSAQKLHEDLGHTAHTFQVTGQQTQLPLGTEVDGAEGIKVVTSKGAGGLKPHIILLSVPAGFDNDGQDQEGRREGDHFEV